MCDGNVKTSQILLPLSLLSFVVALLFSSQAMQIIRDRDVLHQVKAQQEKPLEESIRLKNQFAALVQGTQKLEESGNENVKPLVAKMKELGIIQAPAAPAPLAPSGLPAPVSQSK